MPVVFYEPEEQGRARVMLIHYMPEQLEPARRAQGIELDEIPEPEVREGKAPLPYINPQTGEFWYEYVDRPLTPEESIPLLEQAILELTMLMGGSQ
jgi:hypothetical protein